MAKLLIYNIDDSDLVKLSLISKQVNFIIRKVNPSEYEYKLSDLLRSVNNNSEKVNNIIDECMCVMCDFTQKQFDLFLSKLKENNIIIPIKSVLTPTNRTWNSIFLFNELKKERDYYNNHK